jgi:hypothetical protein
MQIEAQAHKRQGKAKKRVVVECALRDLAKPIGVAEWETRIVKSLPEEFAGCLPSTEEIEAELAREGEKIFSKLIAYSATIESTNGSGKERY